MKYNFDDLAKRKGTNCVKYDEYPYDLPMWVADMDFYLAPKIKEALQKQLDIGAIGYSLVPNDYFSSFVKFYNCHYQTTYKEEEMVYCAGVVACIDSIFKRIGKDNDNVVILSPIYHTFYSCIRNNRRNALASNLIYKDGKYEIDFLDLEQKLQLRNSSILLLCNPHNPIGKIFSLDELKRISDLADKYNVFVISDEIHGLITSPNQKYVPYSLASKNDNYITCLATSKAFNLAGLQSACIHIPDNSIREMLRKGFEEDDIGEPNYFACCANIAALNDSEDWLKEMNEYIYNNKKLFFSLVKENIPSISVIWSDATYMMWVDISSISKDSKSFVDQLAKKTGLLVSPGINFGQNGEGFFRINLATSKENVLLAIQKLKEFIG